MNASALFEKTLQGYCRLSPSAGCSLTKYCKEHHVNIRAFRYWMKQHGISTPKRAKVSDKPSLVPLSILPCPEKEKSPSFSNETATNVRISLPTGAVVSVDEMPCQHLLQMIQTLK